MAGRAGGRGAADDLMRLPRAEGRCAALLAPQGERSCGHCWSRHRVAREAPDSLAASAPLLGRDGPRSLGPGVVPLISWWITDGAGPADLQGDAPRTGLPRRDQLRAAREGCGDRINRIKRRAHGVKRPPTGGLFFVGQAPQDRGRAGGPGCANPAPRSPTWANRVIILLTPVRSEIDWVGSASPQGMLAWLNLGGDGWDSSPYPNLPWARAGTP
jgi:hypothetical protein